MLKLVVLFGSVLLASAAMAGNLTVQVHGANGAPLGDAVVTVTGARAPSGPIRFGWPYVVKQENISFAPHVLIVPVGATVTFPNMDKVRHHVYSFSKPKKFELKLYGHEEARTVVFDKPGIVSIGCNIHDQMSGYIAVVETPYAAVTDASGKAVIPNVPDGNVTLTIWSPSIRVPGNENRQSLLMPSGNMTKAVVTP